MITPDQISLTTHHLHMCFNDKNLASGTGFIYEKDSIFYLVTNWHNVSGRDSNTQACLHTSGAIPNKISTLFRIEDNLGECKRENIELYEDINTLERPVWLEHPTYKKKVDVVAIPIKSEISSKYKLFPINKISFDSEFKTEIADESFVIGYPFSDITYLQLPIWKKASVASEPGVNLDQLPKMYIDTATRSGLSGSPVIMQRIGIHGMVNGEIKSDSIIGRVRNFIGIYSGRIGEDEFKAQLGIVWKKEVLEEIINSK